MPAGLLAVLCMNSKSCDPYRYIIYATYYLFKHDYFSPLVSTLHGLVRHIPTFRIGKKKEKQKCLTFICYICYYDISYQLSISHLFSSKISDFQYLVLNDNLVPQLCLKSKGRIQYIVKEKEY